MYIDQIVCNTFANALGINTETNVNNYERNEDGFTWKITETNNEDINSLKVIGHEFSKSYKQQQRELIIEFTNLKYEYIEKISKITGNWNHFYNIKKDDEKQTLLLTLDLHL